MSLKNFSDLTQREVLAIAIASEEEDNRIYASFAEELADRYPATAKVFQEMAAEEDEHRLRLLEIYQARFGDKLPAIRREDVKGFYSRRPTWLVKNLPLETIRRQAEAMEEDSQRFYSRPPPPRRMWACASCSAISPPSKRATANGPTRSPKRSSPKARARRKGARRTNSSCCNMSSPASPG